MAKVCIKCPQTGKLIPTGWDIDRTSFETMSITDCKIQCPACGQMHRWSKEDAIFGDPKTGPYYEQN